VSLQLRNLDKVLWPRAAFTKGDMVEYYRAVAPALVAHLAGRPLTLRRFPDGVEGPGWYQTNCPPHPDYVRTTVLHGRGGAVYRPCVVDDATALLWVAGTGAVELHPLLAGTERPDDPLALVFDLDPGPGADVLSCCEVALLIRAHLEAIGLVAVPKTSGGVGLHLYVPLGLGQRYETTKPIARALAGRLAEERPDLVVDRQARNLRARRVLVDWLQNERMRSTVAPYSLRATPFPTVSTPVRWEELERALAERRPELLTFEPGDAIARLERDGDLFAPVLELRQSLPA
jgi:bifunctional non-homologous end joining protein LigD